MAYFALLVPSTALAKAAGSSWWSQGATYLWNFVAPYTLWLPAALAVPLVAVRVARGGGRATAPGCSLLAPRWSSAWSSSSTSWRSGATTCTPACSCPAFFALCLPVYVGRARSSRGARPSRPPASPSGRSSVPGLAAVRAPAGARAEPADGVHLQRAQQLDRRHRRAPIRSPRPTTHGPCRVGPAPCWPRPPGACPPAIRSSSSSPTPSSPLDPAAALPARSPLPFRLAVNLPAIGVIGYLAGPDVYVFDEYSLANPIGSHTTVVHHARPGHEKFIGPAWMLGRFGVPGYRPSVPGGPSAASVAAARPRRRLRPAALLPDGHHRAR